MLSDEELPHLPTWKLVAEDKTIEGNNTSGENGNVLTRE